MSKNDSIATHLVLTVIATFGVGCSASESHAVVMFDWAVVGNPGNEGDVQSVGIFGAVDYAYYISKHEVTNSQYVEFLNAVAADDIHGLYHNAMATNPSGGITRSGASPNYSYMAKPGRGDQPVVFVSYFDAMRFANWLENGQPTGAQASGTTEDGVYTIGSGTDEVRESGATYFIPSEHEWYKAAYHKNDGVTGNYWDYPMTTNLLPYSDQPPGDDSPAPRRTANFFKNDSVANGYDDGYAVSGSTAPPSENGLTDVGAYSSAVSAYGTFDQGGNVWEWNENVPAPLRRGLRGGSWRNISSGLHVSLQSRTVVNSESDNTGFRIAGIPEPSTLVLLGMGCFFGTLGLPRRRAT